MKYFAEYLVEKGVLSQDKLIEIMIDQIENSPSTARLVNKSRVLSSDQVLQALKYQSEKNVEFKKACEDLGFWTIDLEIAIRAEFNNLRQPFGVSLLTMGLLGLDQLTKHFDDYFSNQAKEFSATNTPPIAKVS